MFDVDTLVADCRAAASESDARGAVREVLLRTLADPGRVADSLAADVGGLTLLHHEPDLTVLNVIWPPGMVLYPHDHQMWATIGIYAGAEANTLYRRGPERLQAAGDRLLDTGDVFALGPDAIHSVANPRDTFTCAIHVYGGDFVNEPRSQWDPDTLLEEAFDMQQVRQLFAEATRRWRAQLGHDLDDEFA